MYVYVCVRLYVYACVCGRQSDHIAMPRNFLVKRRAPTDPEGAWPPDDVIVTSSPPPLLLPAASHESPDSGYSTHSPQPPPPPPSLADESTTTSGPPPPPSLMTSSSQQSPPMTSSAAVLSSIYQQLVLRRRAETLLAAAAAAKRTGSSSLLATGNGFRPGTGVAASGGVFPVCSPLSLAPYLMPAAAAAALGGGGIALNLSSKTTAAQLERDHATSPTIADEPGLNRPDHYYACPAPYGSIKRYCDSSVCPPVCPIIGCVAQLPSNQV